MSEDPVPEIDATLEPKKPVQPRLGRLCKIISGDHAGVSGYLFHHLHDRCTWVVAVAEQMQDAAHPFSSYESDETFQLTPTLIEVTPDQIEVDTELVTVRASCGRDVSCAFMKISRLAFRAASCFDLRVASIECRYPDDGSHSLIHLTATLRDDSCHGLSQFTNSFSSFECEKQERRMLCLVHDYDCRREMVPIDNLGPVSIPAMQDTEEYDHKKADSFRQHYHFTFQEPEPQPQ